MPATIVLTISVMLQFAAAILALVLVRVTKRKAAWFMIALAILMMGVRRAITMVRLLYGTIEPPEFNVELSALIISVLIVIGVAWIVPFFHSASWVEEKIKKAEHEKALMLDSASEMIAYHDVNHRIQWANKAYIKTTGLSLDELQGKKCYEAWGLKRMCKGCPVAEAIRTGEPHEAELTPENQEN